MRMQQLRLLLLEVTQAERGNLNELIILGSTVHDESTSDGAPVILPLCCRSLANRFMCWVRIDYCHRVDQRGCIEPMLSNQPATT